MIFRNNGKKKNLRGNFGKLSDKLTEYDLYRYIVFIIYMFWTKILFSRVMWEDSKKGEIPKET